MAGAAGEAPSSGGTGAGGALVGSWQHGSLSSLVQFRDYKTGDWLPPSGTGHHLELRAGGACEQSMLIQSSIGSCTTTIFAVDETCDWDFDGQTLTLELGAGVAHSKRSCGGESEKTTATLARVLRYRVRLEDGSMTLIDEAGRESRFTRD